MRELVRYICSSCGGALIVDRNQGIYDCPFCGNAFDGVVIHRDEILADAENNLKQREFHSAQEKFDSILSDRPKDFDALRGLVLCAGKLPSVNTLRKPDKASDCDVENFRKVLDDVLKRAPEEDIPYFEKLSEMLGIAKDYQKLVVEGHKLDKEYESAKYMLKKKLSSVSSFLAIMFLASIAALFIWFVSDINSLINCAFFVIPGWLALFTAAVILPKKIEEVGS